MTSRDIGLGLVGYGYWGPNIARVGAEAEGMRLAAVADGSAAARARAGKRFPGIALHEDWRDLVADPSVDAVAIATPVATHFDVALAALKAGKHVLVEKPMTRSSAEAAILIEEAARRRLVLMVDHTFVFTPAVRKIRDLMSDGVLGEVFYYDSTRINLGLFQTDVNVVWDLAVHDLAILDFLMGGGPASISATGARHVAGRPENTAHIALYFPRGTIAHLNVNWLAPVKIRRTLIGGSRRMVVWDDLEPSEKIKVYDRGVTVAADADRIRDILVSYRSGDMWAPQLSTREALLTAVEHFAACIAGGAAPLTGGESGLRVVEMLEAASRSLAERGRPVEFETVRRAS